MNKNDNEKERKNNKKKFLIVSGISLLTILGGTLAYFTTTSDFGNVFNTSLYQNQIVEKFESPNNWSPGMTTDKSIKVTNTGSINMAVRASYEEKWINALGNEIPLKDSNNNVASIIHFSDDWTKDEDGYYYYGSKTDMTVLKPNKTSTSFITGVTFNENIEATLKETISDDGKTITYESSKEGYDNARYVLTIKIDTIQYDQANNIW